MLTALRSDFVFAVCQAGAEPALKAEVARLHPQWRFAYSRPGFVTWRTSAAVGADVALDAVFARAFGASLGKAADDAAVLACIEQQFAQSRTPLVLHVFARERGESREEQSSADEALVHAVQKRLLAAAPPGTFLIVPRLPRLGELVFDVIVGAAEEPLWLGCHVHNQSHSPHSGGRIPVVLPPEAPSRAYCKLEEALAFSQLPLRAGEVAVEVGSAPGGASWALLQRGLTVVGVDPGAMDARVLALPNFSHLRLPLGELRREHLPPRVDWLLLDVNLAPQVALHGIKRIVSTLRNSLRGVIFTLKLNDWSMAAEVSALCQRVAGMGLNDVRATQLPSNRREFCVVASGRPVRR